MIYRLVSDFHLGTKRAAHTTRESSKKMQDSLFVSAIKCTEKPNTICLGDLFDRSFNNEATLLQGFEVSRRCKTVLTGNHDVSNRSDTCTTMEALSQIVDNIVIAPNISEPYFEVLDDTFWIVPHHASDEVFGQALVKAARHAERSPVKNKYLLLHTNYEIPFNTEDNTLNMTDGQVTVMLDVFSRIFTGHEHNAKTLYDGRMVMVGNHHPSSFGELTDKYRWILDTDTDELTKELIWSEDRGHREIKFGDPLPDLEGVQFVDVIGSEPVDNGVEVAEYVRSVWNNGVDLLAVRNNVEIIDHLADSEVDTSEPALVDLKKRISDDLKGSDLQDVYSSLLQIAEESQ